MPEPPDGLRGRYRIERELGRGGMSTVHLAHDLRHDRQVALKVLSPECVGPASAERFLREIQVVAQMTHPHILPLIDSGRIDAGAEAGQPYYVMPYVPGESLRAKLDREKQLSLEDTQRIIREVADALDFAHAHGVVHRDVKPENILLLEGHAIVADFGIARALGADAERVTATGMIVGTPTYMSPEQASSDQAIDGRADQYALACVAYEMLAGTPPFVGPTIQSLIARHAVDIAPAIRIVRPELPVEVEAALRRAMAKAPADRFATTQDFARALAAARGSGPRVNRRRSASIALLAVGIIAMLVVAYRSRSTGVTRATNLTRVAVLPLRSVSPDPADSYFAEGMTDEITSVLAGNRALKVIARSSIDAYATSNTNTAELGRKLDVGSIVSGSVRKLGNQVRISIELSDPLTGESRWSHTYERTVTDVFAIQRDVAAAVAGALEVAINGAWSASSAKRPVDTAAYTAYLRASILISTRTMPGNARPRFDSALAILHFAVERDSTFAPAWASLGLAYSAMIFNFGAPPPYRDSAFAATARALRLDSTMADAYRARSNLAFTHESGWRIPEALTDILHAVALKPSGADERSNLASLLFHIGLLPEAEHELRAALEVDPANDFVKYRIPRTVWQQQRFDEALRIMVRDRQAGWRTSIAEEAMVLGYLGRMQEGMALLDKYGPAFTQQEDIEASRAVLLARLGKPQEAKQHIANAERVGGGRSHFHHASFAIATAFAIMGERDEAVHWLERTAGDGMPAYSLFLRDPTLARLQGMPRYEALMTRLKAQTDGYRAVYMAAGI